MTEAEWLENTDPRQMFQSLASSITGADRKFRLFACATARLGGDNVETHCRLFLDVAERYADNQASEEARERAFQAGEPSLRNERLNGIVLAWLCLRPNARNAAFSAICRTESTRLTALLLREIFGSLHFQPITLDSKCLTPPVNQLAEAIYDDRNFAQLPILADLLQEAGCDQEEVLKHLRGGGEHVRGCWALDLMLGKE